ncbi:MAG: hypothetical protein R6X02_23135 [Enhygromyxa sp.]
MANAQQNLAANAPALVNPLEDAGIPWRLGVTTTDNGNPRCTGTSPEGGILVMSSCRARLSDFELDGLDVGDLSCQDACGVDSLGVLPTATEVDATVKPRKWLESVNGETNVSVPIYDALACMLPQGINGCGFESQLESAYLAVARAQSSQEDNWGFLGADSLLVVIFVSDEADCSYNKNFGEIFEGNKTFWSDPSAAAPTSAVCWNAGVECIGDPSGYDSCLPANKDVNGAITNDPGKAVMQPIERYVDGLQTDIGPVLVFGILGVSSDGSVAYADAVDPAFQKDYGIGPGCMAQVPLGQPITAVPPVRMLAVMDELGGANMAFSICDSDYSPALSAMGKKIASYF